MTVKIDEGALYAATKAIADLEDVQPNNLIQHHAAAAITTYLSHIQAEPAHQIIGEIEERFPNWKSYRDLIDCIDCTLHDYRSASPAPAGRASVIEEMASWLETRCENGHCGEGRVESLYRHRRNDILEAAATDMRRLKRPAEKES